MAWQPWAQQLAAALAAVGAQLDLSDPPHVSRAAVRGQGQQPKLERQPQRASCAPVQRTAHPLPSGTGGNGDRAAAAPGAAYLPPFPTRYGNRTSHDCFTAPGTMPSASLICSTAPLPCMPSLSNLPSDSPHLPQPAAAAAASQHPQIQSNHLAISPLCRSPGCSHAYNSYKALNRRYKPQACRWRAAALEQTLQNPPAYWPPRPAR